MGLLTAAWLLESGATSLVLSGRAGRVSRVSDLTALIQGPGLVTLFAGDASAAEAADNLAFPQRLPVGGVLHAAGLQASISASLKFFSIWKI